MLKFLLPTEIAQREFVNKNRTAGFLPCYKCYITPYHKTFQNVSNPDNCFLSEFFTNIKVNMTVTMSIMQLEKFIKLCEMEMRTGLHQEMSFMAA